MKVDLFVDFLWESNMEFNTLLKNWVETHRPYWALSTYIKYERIYRCALSPAFDGIKSEELNPELLEEKSIQIQTTLPKNSRVLPTKPYIEKYFYLLRETILKGQKQRLIPLFEYEFKQVKATREISPRPQPVLSKDEESRLINLISSKTNSTTEENLSLAVLMALTGGLRIGEVAGLKWEDFDFENETVSIKRKVYNCPPELNNGSPLEIVFPKTKSSVRSIPVNSGLCSRLKNFREKYNLQGFCFPAPQDFHPNSTIETPCSPDYIRQFLNRLTKTLEFENIHFHSLRHTFATRCIDSGISPKTVSQLLGHSSVKTTMDLYVHPGEEEKKKCVELFSL